MIETLTLNQAIERCPSIAATEPAAKASKQYNFISTLNILNSALDNDWLIRSVKGTGSRHGMHNIALVHKSQIEKSVVEGFPQVNIVNSHNLTKRFSTVLGFFRLVCSNGLVAPTGMMTSVQPTLHRLSSGKSITEDINTVLEKAFGQYDTIVNQTQLLKERQLTEEERTYLARYAYYIRFRYRMSQPKKVDASTILAPRREADAGTDLWTTFNVIQENLTQGGNRIGSGITRVQDDLKFNQELWTGVDKALLHRDSDLETTLKALFPKKQKTN